MPLTFSKPDPAAIPLHLIASDQLDDALAALPDTARTWAQTQSFKAGHGELLTVPAPDGTCGLAMVGLGSAQDRARTRFPLAAARRALPDATFDLVSDLPEDALAAEYLGWLLAGYSFSRYRTSPAPKARLLAPQDPALAHRLEVIATGEALTRDLINTPAEDMGPADLADAAKALADQMSAKIEITEGEALLDKNFPMIHTVGRAADRAPRLIDMRWGESGPQLTLVGKGVCFDTGGLNLKPGASMGLMKKDMGGAATVLGLAHMIMALQLPLRLRVLIPAVENAVAGNAFRPGDILTSRKGLTVEINNTDAEGRLVLADALALADEDTPDLVVSMATLTGAARVAVGPDLAPFYTDSDTHAESLSRAAGKTADPVWRMPFHAPYEKMIEPGIADLDNAPSGGFAGSITAALFLRRFVDNAPYMHFDIYGWNPTAAPGRPKGGVGMGARALLDALPDMLDL
ncbi:leucyl aminopeptidase family protein [Aliishimia ponticola]|uniref:Leucyl aminopeptidase family protein n=1 Tax=Aliishimia ponticola TaxID=2499833 RepID=A0A4V3XKE0_9RHOB|nr:leucyl aminopeptidase family protein [Aliishimia ponticola]THH36593.1 leucyl aminopeptidase family protein [Aliishimia ponticola]